MVIDLAGDLRGFPRHLSQHTGGMVITRSPLSEVVPIENAAMADRTVIEWDKDDLDALGILKIDILGLGMLTCVRKALGHIRDHHRRDLTLATVPAEDPKVYDMLCEGDSIGVFQVESRAQMSMLPRLRPRNFYDLVIEVAIVRPGPIQGDMVHPYLRRRQGLEPVAYPSPELERVLSKTLGIPLFQEQAMRIAIVAAGFTPSEADGLRRAMATFRRSGTIHGFKDKFIQGILGRGYEKDFAERCFKQIEGFADYGFPESHAASFALIVYVSAWLRRHYPAAFACALLNSQPMGFYAPAQIVGDARRHGVEIRPVDVNFSHWDCTLEPVATGDEDPRDCAALRLGFRQIKGLAARDAGAIVTARRRGYRDVAHLWREAAVGAAALKTLAGADAFGSLNLDRQQAFWAVNRLKDAPLPLFAATESGEIGRRVRGPASAHRGARTGGQRLPCTAPVIEGAPAVVAARAAGSKTVYSQRAPGRREERLEGQAGGAGHHPPAPRQRQRRHVHHPRGRNRPCQPDHLAHGVRALPPSGARCHHDGGGRTGSARRNRHSRGGPAGLESRLASRRTHRLGTAGPGRRRSQIRRSVAGFSLTTLFSSQLLAKPGTRGSLCYKIANRTGPGRGPLERGNRRHGR